MTTGLHCLYSLLIFFLIIEFGYCEDNCDDTLYQKCKNKNYGQFISNNSFQLVKDEVSDSHTEYRMLYGLGFLCYNKTLEESAEKALNEFVQEIRRNSHYVQFNGSNTENGENYALVGSTCPNAKSFNGELPVQEWHRGMASYEAGENSTEARYYSQLVWKNTTTMGTAVRYITTCIRGIYAPMLLVLTHYYPPGNIEGQFEENVLPLQI